MVKWLSQGLLVKLRSLISKIVAFDKEVMNSKICSEKTIRELQEILKNVVVRGTGEKLYSPNFSMAGKTGTAQTEYWMDDWNENKRYVSSFVGYFPAENPKYSCIVVIHKPSIEKGFYGADVSGPVFKTIAQKIFTDTPLVDEVKTVEFTNTAVEKDFEDYYMIARTYKTIMPDIKGLSAMDAVTLLENMGLKVKLVGNGKVTSQSISRGTKLKKNQTVTLQLS